MSGWTEDGLQLAWRALAQPVAGEDWRIVHFVNFGAIAVKAGCHFPNGREALIVSFPGALQVNPAKLPEGNGFDVSFIQGQAEFAGRTAIALVRRPEGSLDIFSIIVVDILRTLETAAKIVRGDALTAFLERLQEWQAFMAKTRGPLSSEAQIGLFGELWILRLLSETSLGEGALDCWQGPLRAAQDFHIFGGAIEIKSTASAGNFYAKINSIEQLDSERTPMFLGALKFEETADGISLVELVASLRAKLKMAGVGRGFDALLLVMGYLEEHEHLYARPLTLRETKILRVGDDLPRLTRAALPAVIRSANYVLDLDAIEGSSLALDDIIHEFGTK